MGIVPDAVAHTPAMFRPRGAGIAARVAAALGIVALVLFLPVVADVTWDGFISRAAIFAIIGLSVNVLTGHAGQISLGHQAFVGIGAFMSSFVAVKLGVVPASFMPTANFFLAVAVAAAVGGMLALLLGLVALRIRGLYLALITLAFGLMAEGTIFNWRAFTGGGAGTPAPRPAMFVSQQSYAYVSLLFVALFLFVDWRLTKTKAGRAVVALRNDERVAATLGVNVTGYKLLAFVLSGTMAGAAGSLFAHRQELVQAADFELRTALLWVIMAVVGGLGSRAGVVIGSAFFAIFPSLFPGDTITVPFFGEIVVQILAPLLGALLLVLTITLYPGGIGQQLFPFRRWLAGGPLVESRHEALRLSGFPALAGLAVVVILMHPRLGMGMAFAVGLAGAVAGAILGVFLFTTYLTRYHRRLRAHRPPPTREPAAAAPVPEEITREVEAAAASESPADAPTAVDTPLQEPAGPGSASPSGDGEPTQPIHAARGARGTRSRRRRKS